MSLLYFKNTSIYHKGICWCIRLALAIIIMLYGNVVWAETHSSTPTCTLPISVGDAYIRSFDSKDIESSDTLAKESDKMQAKYEIRPPQLDPATIRRTIFNSILAKSAKLQAVLQQIEPILNPYAWSDLKLFYGTTTAPSYHLMSRINRTTTILGEAVLAILLVTPTSDIITLQAKQQKLKTLLTNPTQLDSIKSHLKAYQDIEQSMTSFFTSRDPLSTKEYIKYMEDNFFFSNKSAKRNKSVGVLEFRKRIMKDLVQIQASVIYPCIYPLGYEIFGHDKMNMKIPNTSITQRNLVWSGIIPIYGPFRLYSVYKKHEYEGFALSMISSCIGSCFTLYGFYAAFCNYKEYSEVLKNLALRMADVQAFIFTIDKINRIIRSCPELETHYSCDLTAIRALLAECKQQDTEVGRLLRFFKTIDFKDWSYFFNNSGKLLVCWKLFMEHKDAFIDAMYELGLLDAHCSFATLMQEAQGYHSEHAYVFAEFIDHAAKPKPYIAAENMWNSFLDSKQAVGNHLTMDATIKGGVRNVILTGPNAGGKSTFLTGVTQSLLLAQVMGIAAADKFVFTPFHKINTYIDIADDIAAGKSLFLAEVDRAQQHIQILKDLKPKEFSFTIFDEPFSGTNPIEGAAAEYSILKSLADYTNSFTIVATHYPLMMLLEERAKNKGFANYKVCITREGKGQKLKYTYKVVPGKSNQTIAIDILEEMGYDTDLLNDARDIIKHPQKYKAKF